MYVHAARLKIHNRRRGEREFPSVFSHVQGARDLKNEYSIEREREREREEDEKRVLLSFLLASIRGSR